MGTPHYMSPEQVKGKRPISAATSSPSALVLYELLPTSKAFPGEAPHVVLHNIVHTEPRPIAELVPDIDPDLARIVERGLLKRPSDRYQELAMLATDLGRIRARLVDSSSDTVIIREPGSGVSSGPSRPPSGRTPVSGRAPAAGGRKIHNLEVLAQRRAEQIEAHVRKAVDHLDQGSHEAAVEECELAILIDPEHPHALELLDRAHQAIDDQRLAGWLGEARAELSRGALSEAGVLIQQSLKLRPDSQEAQQLDQDLRGRRREQERAIERARALRLALERARANLASGALDAALRGVGEALAYDETDEEARALKQQVVEAIEDRQRQVEAEQRAAAAAEAQRAAAAEAQRAAAVEAQRAAAAEAQRVAAAEAQRVAAVEAARAAAAEAKRVAAAEAQRVATAERAAAAEAQRVAAAEAAQRTADERRRKEQEQEEARQLRAQQAPDWSNNPADRTWSDPVAAKSSSDLCDRFGGERRTAPGNRHRPHGPRTGPSPAGCCRAGPCGPGWRGVRRIFSCCRRTTRLGRSHRPRSRRRHRRQRRRSSPTCPHQWPPPIRRLRLPPPCRPAWPKATTPRCCRSCSRGLKRFPDHAGLREVGVELASLLERQVAAARQSAEGQAPTAAGAKLLSEARRNAAFGDKARASGRTVDAARAYLAALESYRAGAAQAKPVQATAVIPPSSRGNPVGPVAPPPQPNTTSPTSTLPGVAGTGGQVSPGAAGSAMASATSPTPPPAGATSAVGATGPTAGGKAATPVPAAPPPVAPPPNVAPPPVSPPPVPDAAAVLAAERQAVTATLERFRVAYSARDLAALKAVFQPSSATEKIYQGLAATLGDRSVTSVTLTLGPFEPQVDGQRAQVTSAVVIAIRRQTDRGIPPTGHPTYRFTLDKVAGTWKIVNLEIR